MIDWLIDRFIDWLIGPQVIEYDEFGFKIEVEDYWLIDSFIDSLIGPQVIEYDEFGFKIEVEDGPEQCSSKLLSTPFSDNQGPML
jgi:hypothetical protein